jgi:hypothetical protein
MPQAPLNTGTNTANATGSVTILYPTNHPQITYSPGAVVAKVVARFDIRPSATRFTLSVAAAIGSTVVDGTTISFDPVTGEFTANVPSPVAAWRQGDFSQTGQFAMDFLANTPIPGSIIPLSRIDQNLMKALNSVPLSNSPATGLHAFYTVTGKSVPGSTFVMDANANVDLLNFASFGFLSRPPGDLPVTVTLSVDGQVLDVATATYKSPL